jgi:F0F1-type ATP synthase membrane subunit b/b'
MALILKRPVVVKHIVTEAFKEAALREVAATLEQIERNLEQMEFQGRRMVAELERQAPSQAIAMREELKRERQRQEALRDELLAKQAQIASLEVNSLFVSGTYEAPVQLNVGERFGLKMRQAEILVKDDIIVDIRE